MKQKKLQTYFSKAVFPAPLCHASGSSKSPFQNRKQQILLISTLSADVQQEHFPINLSNSNRMQCILGDLGAVAEEIPGSKRHFT